MLTVNTRQLDLVEGSFINPAHMRVQVAFPINRWTGSRDSAVVYFEVKPGDRLASHTDSAEEILYIVAGEAEAQVGSARARLSAGGLAVIPAMVPHGLVNVGSETVKVVGFFAGAEVISTFAEPIQPFGASVVNQGAPVPAEAVGA